MKYLPARAITICLLHLSVAFANPTNTGSSGVVKSPSADTLIPGAICVGLWCDAGSSASHSYIIMPVSLTVGLTNFWEIYGAYPNLLFNHQEDTAGTHARFSPSLDGTARVGTKVRLGRAGNAPSRVAVDIFARRHFSRDTSFDGLIDVGGRLICSVGSPLAGLHLYGGYVRNEQPWFAAPSPLTIDVQNQFMYGAAGEYAISPRSSLSLEVTGSSPRTANGPHILDAFMGVRSYLSPLVAFSLSAGRGFNDAGGNWRVIAGLSTCQSLTGQGPALPLMERTPAAKQGPSTRQVKVLAISPLMVRSAATPSDSRLEIPVPPEWRDIVITPFGQLSITPQLASAPAASLSDVAPEPSIPQSAPQGGDTRSSSLADPLAFEYTLARMAGRTPLYGVVVDDAGVRATDGVKSFGYSKAVSVYRSFRFADTIPDFGSPELPPDIVAALGEIASIARKDLHWRYLVINGHTDSIGSPKYNRDLSLQRATAIAGHLVSREGIDPVSVFIVGQGGAMPITDNATQAARAKNRRFEVLFLVDR